MHCLVSYLKVAIFYASTNMFVVVSVWKAEYRLGQY